MDKQSGLFLAKEHYKHKIVEEILFIGIKHMILYLDATTTMLFFTLEMI